MVGGELKLNGKRISREMRANGKGIVGKMVLQGGSAEPEMENESK